MATPTFLAKLRIVMVQLLCWLLCCHASFSPRCSPHDRSALLAIEGDMDLPQLWTGNHCCDWAGVSCTAENRVSALALNVPEITSLAHGIRISTAICELQMLQYLNIKVLRNLEGSIPHCLCNLQMLQTLRFVNGGSLEGGIPPCLGELQELTDLEIVDMDVGGSFPPLCKLKMLQTLDLGGNGFGGSILPSCLGELQELTYLDLSDNALVGSIPLSFCKLHKLQSLDLDSNALGGSIPLCLSELRQLTSLDLSGNSLVGVIPASLGELRQLTYLDLSGNSLVGVIPASLGSLKMLKWLDLSYNQQLHISTDVLCKLSSIVQYLSLSSSGINGTLPPCLFQLRNPVSLQLDGNELTGAIPAELKNPNLTQLVELDLGNNRLKIGELPSWLWTLPTLQLLSLSSCGISSVPACDIRMSASGCSLQYLDLSGNPLNSDMHTAMAGFQIDSSLNLSSCGLKGLLSRDFLGGINLTTLQTLDLSHNRLVGTIPSALGNMSELATLDLSHNRLRGLLPTSLAQSRSLLIIHLGDNFLEGPIPEGLGQLCPLYTLSLPRNNLSGTFPIRGNYSNLMVLDLSNNHLEGTLHDLSLSSMPNLRVLVLASNIMSGTIEGSFNNVSATLQVIDLSNNNFSGSIPLNLQLPAFWRSLDATLRSLDATLGISDDGRLYEEVVIDVNDRDNDYSYVLLTLVALNLQGNHLTGTIPESLSNLSNIVYLNLSNNHLTGSIPPSLSKLHNLESLDLSENNLTGRIPPGLSALNFLAFLNLSYNDLDGPIPSGNQFYTFTASSFEGNEGLCDPLKDRHILKPCNQPHPPSHTPRQPSDSNFQKFLDEWAPIPQVCVSYVVSLIFHLWLLNRLLNRLFPR